MTRHFTNPDMSILMGIGGSIQEYDKEDYREPNYSPIKSILTPHGFQSVIASRSARYKYPEKGVVFLFLITWQNHISSLNALDAKYHWGFITVRVIPMRQCAAMKKHIMELSAK